jgi:hypothetical protein
MGILGKTIVLDVLYVKFSTSDGSDRSCEVLNSNNVYTSRSPKTGRTTESIISLIILVSQMNKFPTAVPQIYPSNPDSDIRANKTVINVSLKGAAANVIDEYVCHATRRVTV